MKHLKANGRNGITISMATQAGNESVKMAAKLHSNENVVSEEKADSGEETSVKMAVKQRISMASAKHL
jgi:hypothetical protein